MAGFCGENNAPQGVPPASTMINARSVCHGNNEKNVFPSQSIWQDFSLIYVIHTKKKKKLKRKTFSQPCVFHKSLRSKSLQFLNDITELQGKTLEKL